MKDLYKLVKDASIMLVFGVALGIVGIGVVFYHLLSEAFYKLVPSKRPQEIDYDEFVNQYFEGYPTEDLD